MNGPLTRQGQLVAVLLVLWAIIMFASAAAASELTLGTFATIIVHGFGGLLVIGALVSWLTGNERGWDLTFAYSLIITVAAAGLAAFVNVTPFALLTAPVIAATWLFSRRESAARVAEWEKGFLDKQAIRSKLQTRSTEGAVFDDAAAPSDRDAHREADSRERYPSTKAELRAKLKRQDEDPWSN